MEKAKEPKKLSAAEIRVEIARLGQEIIGSEHKLQGIHEEYGDNSPEDNAQEAQSDEIARQLLREKTEANRLRMIELQDELGRVEKAA